MAIPTQFSVAKARKCPLANPNQPIDGASPLTAESIGFISGASALPAKSAGDIDNASLFSALSVCTINNPLIISAESAAPVETDISLINKQSFNFSNTDNGFTIENGTLTVNATSITISNSTNDMRLIREPVDYMGSDSYIVRIRLRCTTANVDDTISVLYKNSAHAYSADYSVSKSVSYEQGVYQVLDFNLRGDDFSKFGADGLRFDIYNKAAPESFEIDYIHVGSYDSGFSPEPVKSIDEPIAVTPEIEQAINLPSVVPSESEAAISSPTPLTANPATQTSGKFPLNHARILYNNVLRGYSNVSVTNAQNGLFALTYNTSQKWTFTGGNVITVELPANVDIDTICVCAHTLGSGNFSVGAEWSPDTTSGFVPLTPGKNPSNDAPLMFHLSGSTVSARRVRIIVSGGTQAGIGYISAGISLQMQRPFFNGHNPFIDSDVTEFYSKRTESGERIGRDIRRRGYETSFEWQNLDDAWYRENIPDFKEAAKTAPIVVAWNLLEYPNDIAFGETTGDMRASMQNGTRTKRSGLSFTLAGV